MSVALLPVLRSHSTGDPILTFKNPNKLSAFDIAEYKLVLHHLVRYYPGKSMLPANLRDGLIKIDSKLNMSGEDGVSQFHWCTNEATSLSSLLQYTMRFVRRDGISDCMAVNRLKVIYRDVLELRKAERGGEEEPCDASADDDLVDVREIEYIASSQEAEAPLPAPLLDMPAAAQPLLDVLPGAAPPLLGVPAAAQPSLDQPETAQPLLGAPPNCAEALQTLLPLPALPNVPTPSQTPLGTEAAKLRRELRRHETAPACLDMARDRLTRAEANEIAIANGWPPIGIGFA